MGGYKCYLNFSEDVLQVLSVSEGAFLSDFGDTEFESIINNTSGYVWLNATQEGTSRTIPHGSGTLASIVFNATTRPPAKSDLLLHQVEIFEWQHLDELIPTQSITNGKYEMFEIVTHVITREDQSFTVQTRSNSSVSATLTFSPENKSLTFDVTGDTGTRGYCEITIPKTLLKADSATAWQVTVGGTLTSFTVLQENDTHTTLAFSYDQSVKTVKVIGTWAIGQAGFLLADWMIIAIVIVVIVILLLITVWYMRKRKKS
jgi:hypothetical protein